jgi:hypothetical protein
VFFSRDDDPIDSVEEQCIENNGSTMGIAGCYSASYEYLKADIEYLIRDLATRRNLGVEASEFAESMKGARRAYASLLSALWDQDGGSIGAINQVTTMLRLMYGERGALGGLY